MLPKLQSEMGGNFSASYIVESPTHVSHIAVDRTKPEQIGHSKGIHRTRTGRALATVSPATRLIL
jgi:hypothetical protein